MWLVWHVFFWTRPNDRRCMTRERIMEENYKRTLWELLLNGQSHQNFIHILNLYRDTDQIWKPLRDQHSTFFLHTHFHTHFFTRRHTFFCTHTFLYFAHTLLCCTHTFFLHFCTPAFCNFFAHTHILLQFCTQNTHTHTFFYTLHTHTHIFCLHAQFHFLQFFTHTQTHF